MVASTGFRFAEVVLGHIAEQLVALDARHLREQRNEVGLVLIHFAQHDLVLPLRAPDTRRAVPLPDGVACYAIAGTTAVSPGGVKDRLVGDGLVPVASALGRHKDRARALEFPADRQWVACGTGHLDLLSRSDVYEQVAGWLVGNGR